MGLINTPTLTGSIGALSVISSRPPESTFNAPSACPTYARLVKTRGWTLAESLVGRAENAP